MLAFRLWLTSVTMLSARNDSLLHSIRCEATEERPMVSLPASAVSQGCVNGVNTVLQQVRGGGGGGGWWGVKGLGFWRV